MNPLGSYSTHGLAAVTDHNPALAFAGYSAKNLTATRSQTSARSNYGLSLPFRNLLVAQSSRDPGTSQSVTGASGGRMSSIR